MRNVVLALAVVVWLAAALMTPAGASAVHVEPADINDDCVLNSLDLLLVSQHYGAVYGSLLYSPVFDMNDDRRIDVRDLQYVAGRFGTAVC